MAVDSPSAELDELMTEAIADGDLVLDELSVAELVTLMNDRDARIADAVREALPTIAAAIDATSDRMRAGEQHDRGGGRCGDRDDQRQAAVHHGGPRRFDAQVEGARLLDRRNAA